MKIKLTLLLSFAILIVPFISSAHNLGGELKISYNGGYSYNIDVNVYKETTGVQCPTTVTVYFYNTSDSTQNFNTLANTNYVDHTMDLNHCSSYVPSGGSNIIDLNVRTFSFNYVTITSGTWVVGVEIPCRTNSDLTYGSPNSIYLKAEINNTITPAVSTLDFEELPPFIVKYDDLDTNIINNRVITTSSDDSIHYSLSQPMLGNNNYLNYSNANYQNFLNAVYLDLDSSNGQLGIFQGPYFYGQLSSFYLIKVEHWKRIPNHGIVLASVTYREAYIKIIKDLNQTYPIISGIDTLLNASFTNNQNISLPQVHLGDTLRFIINTHDQDSVLNPSQPNSSSLTIEWDKQLNNASIMKYRSNTASAYAIIEFIPDSNDLAEVYKDFSLVVSDDACPYIYQTIRHFRIEVLPPKQSNSIVNHDASLPKLIISPNPNNGMFNLAIDNAINSPFQLNIFNLNGQLVYQKDFSHMTHAESINLDLTNLPPSVYLLQMKTTNTNQTKRFIIE
jgi:hypothetical protein